jgi:DNA-binding transcriptional regulator YiaG
VELIASAYLFFKLVLIEAYFKFLAMKSPFTGGAARLEKEMRTMEFRKEDFLVCFQYYLCLESEEQFTDEQLDEVNINQVYNQYRAKYGIPFPDEINAIREQYGLGASKMSEILGLGINSYRNYEAGEVPSIANGRLIQLVKDPKEFQQLIEISKNEFSAEELVKIHKKINHALAGWNERERMYETIILGEKRPGLLNGYRIPNLAKINNMVLFFAQKVKPFKTKMNKLLFYADFLHFKQTGYSISGLTYQAIQKGPVPKNYDWIFDNTVEKKMITISFHDYGDYIGEQFLPTDTSVFDETLFSTSELAAMQAVANYFERATVKEIVNKSHEEMAWILNVEELKPISYLWGFELKYPEIAT